MVSVVIISKNANKDLRKVPARIIDQLQVWIKTIEKGGYLSMQQIKGYRDHALKGNRNGQRSSSLTRSWRVIYSVDESINLITIEVLEVNHHDY
jgi:proteic killer suppression protein